MPHHTVGSTCVNRCSPSRTHRLSGLGAAWSDVLPTMIASPATNQSSCECGSHMHMSASSSSACRCLTHSVLRQVVLLLLLQRLLLAGRHRRAQSSLQQAAPRHLLAHLPGHNGVVSAQQEQSDAGVADPQQRHLQTWHKAGRDMEESGAVRWT